MKKPIIFSVDDDPQVLQSIQRDLRNQYKRAYRIMSTTSAEEALESLAMMKKKGDVVALFLSDQRMPEMLGVEFLEKAKGFYPEAKRVLLTAYSDTDAAIKAINDVQLDYYLMKPWDPPTEKLYPVLDDLLEAWNATYVPEFTGLRIVGYTWSPKSHKIKDYLSGNLIPYQYLDIETNDRTNEVIERYELSTDALPALVFEDGSVLQDPSLIDVAGKLGKHSQAKETMYDVAIIGAGPAGLAAAVYGGSEGLKTVLIEKRAPGGQAGTSSRIENYLGFPSGLSGSDLARRAITQAERFGIEFLSPQEVTAIRTQNGYKIVSLGDGSELNAKTIIVTTGVDYRKLEATGVDNFTGAGVYYGAATTEAANCRDKDVYVVGGGNSAGQAAMYLSNFANNVYIMIRKPDLTSSMSAYLIDQIDGTENIHLLPGTQVKEANGNEKLQQLALEDIATGSCRTVDAGALFIFIGARPYTDWTAEHLIRNQRGYIETGQNLQQHTDFSRVWKQQRAPYLLETCEPGIFAAGDVRAGAMNRVASAVGEGSMAISFVHKYLAEN